MIFLLAALAIGGTLLSTSRGRAILAKLRAQRIIMPSLVALLGVLLSVKGDLLVGGAVLLGALIWTGRTQRARLAPRRNVLLETRLRDASMLLGVPLHADRETILAAHRRLIARHHPDAGGVTETAGSINAARDLLLDHVVS